MIGSQHWRQFSRPMRSKTKTTRLASATCVCFVFWLVMAMFVYLLWLARVTTLILVLRHSIKNRSYGYDSYSSWGKSINRKIITAVRLTFKQMFTFRFHNNMISNKSYSPSDLEFFDRRHSSIPHCRANSIAYKYRISLVVLSGKELNICLWK